ncbi:DNA-binding NarL/FixJ family response regulator [Nocardia sp. GAS34]|uniref:LuxR C-terminal-related transcriptional regulator n=1 Tax=unclassified Nocardia TaxID=2637762 RepID=UPI003D224555
MTTTSSTRPLLRLVSSLVLAISAMMLATGSAIAESPISASNEAAELDVGAARHAAISILLTGEHVLFRTGLHAVINGQPDMHCVAEIGDGAAAAGEIRRLRPDIVLLDLDMPGLDDPAIDRIATLGHSTRILTLATSGSDENLYRALRLGASGFLTKSLPALELIEAVRTAARGNALIDPHQTRRLITRLTNGIEPFPAAPEIETLTAREHQVLLLIARAYTNPEIARALGVGEQTVKSHVSNLLTKLGVRDRVHAAVYAHTRRIVSPHPAPDTLPG